MMTSTKWNRLLDYISERSRIVGNAPVASENVDKLRRFAQQLSRRKVNGIERADRFHRERFARTREY